MADSDSTIYGRISEVLDTMKSQQDARIEAVLVIAVAEAAQATAKLQLVQLAIDDANTGTVANSAAATQAAQEATALVATASADLATSLTALSAALSSFNTDSTSALASLESEKTAKIAEVNTALAAVNAAVINVQPQINAAIAAYVPQWADVAGKPATFPAAPHAHAFGDLTDKPTTLSGYGITDASTEAQIDDKIAALVGASPTTLDTLAELGAAFGNDPNFATTITTALAGKAAATHTHSRSHITDFDHNHNWADITGAPDFAGNLTAGLATKMDADAGMKLAVLVAGTDLNTVVAAGSYRCDNPHLNMPDGGYGQLLVVQGGADTVAQVYFPYNNANVWVRQGNPSDVGGNGSWRPWKRLLNTDDLTDRPKVLVSATEPAGMVDGDIWLEV